MNILYRILLVGILNSLPTAVFACDASEYERIGDVSTDLKLQMNFNKSEEWITCDRLNIAHSFTLRSIMNTPGWQCGDKLFTQGLTYGVIVEGLNTHIRVLDPVSAGVMSLSAGKAFIFSKSGRKWRTFLDFSSVNRSVSCKIVNGTTELITYKETANYTIEDSSKVFALRLNGTNKYNLTRIEF